MKRIALATSLACSLLACSQDAEIGIDSQPVSCTDVGAAEVTGRVTDPFNGTDYEFGTVTPRIAGTTSETYTAILDDGTIQLRLGFQCGAAELGSYGIAPGTDQQLECPFEVTGAVLGRIEYLGANSGTLIVDESSDCLAGRFAVDFGEHGEISGWFSSAWQ